MKRRNFIKAGAILGVGAAIPAFSIHHHLNRQYKVGILGYGDRGSGLHSVLAQMPEKYKVTAICETLDFRIQNARKTMLDSDVKVFKDHREMAAYKGVDIIFIATPLSMHFDHAKTALQAGKHIYLEKAMTHTIEEAKALQELHRQFPKQTIQVGHQYRYSPLYFKVKDYIQSGYLGKVTQIESRWDRNHNWRRHVPSPELERQINWRMYEEYSGGLVAELLSHQMDFVHWAFDTVPTNIFGTGGIDHFKDGRETFDNVQVVVRYEEEGIIGNYGATCSNQYEGYIFKIKGSKGTISLLTNDGYFYPEPDHLKELQQIDGVSGATKIEWSNNKEGIKLLNEPLKDGTYYALEDFYKSIEKSTEPYSNVFNGGNTSIAVAMANESLKTGVLQKWQG
ncbi:Gfo/Idh/MocA family protein [Belliella marina]|uniref:Gfo/Idh/MocA family protein n=1 Tax=Belliella marina TaxID=1644146 RepID=A0ABW4VN52_9BACT